MLGKFSISQKKSLDILYNLGFHEKFPNFFPGFLAYNPVDALGAVELPNREFLLIFNTLGVYVDMQGRKSRDKEIMYPALPEKVAICDGKLLVYSDTHIDVFDTQSGDWVQSINIRKTRPLLKSGHLNLSMLQEMPHVTFLSNISRGMC